MRVRFPLFVGATALALILSGCGGEAGTPVAGTAPPTGVTQAPSESAAATGAPGTEADSDSGSAGEGGAATPAEQAPGGAGGTMASSSPAPEPVNRQVDKTGWYDGFAITVGEVVAEPSSSGDYVSVTATLMMENLADASNYPQRPFVTSDGLTIEGFMDAAEIPAGGKAEATLTFGMSSDDPASPLDPDAALDTVALTWGEPADNQTVIPLAADAEVDSIEPVKLDVSGTITQDQINVEVTGRSLAPSYEPGEKGKALLTLHVALTCGAECIASGYNVNQSEFSITGPDGQSVVADQRSGYCCTALYPGTTDDNANNTLVFVVPLPGTGDYTLTYENPRLKDEGADPATLEFTA